jgi:histidinol phosphatase-like enzyme (inositol monophosphatase family)
LITIWAFAFHPVPNFILKMPMTPFELEKILNAMCDLAAKETLPRFRTRLVVENKASLGFDPVTQADQAAEAAMRKYVMDNFPEHGFVGEEAPPHQEYAEYCWIVDPVDGTRAFISGLPSWGTLIGLVHNGKPIAGIMHQPYIGERFVAAGEGAFLRRGTEMTVLSTSKVTRLDHAILLTTSPYLFDPAKIDRYKAVESRCKLARYGFDCYGYAMVAAGHADLVIESGLNSFDVAGLIPLVEQAGGIMTTWENGPAIDGGYVVAAANPELHAEALEFLST